MFHGRGYIEFVHLRKLLIITQRELGWNALIFALALKKAPRHDPHINLMFELHACETVSTTLTIAEMGALLLACSTPIQRQKA